MNKTWLLGCHQESRMLKSIIEMHLGRAIDTLSPTKVVEILVDAVNWDSTAPHSTRVVERLVDAVSWDSAAPQSYLSVLYHFQVSFTHCTVIWIPECGTFFAKKMTAYCILVIVDDGILLSVILCKYCKLEFYYVF